MKTCSLSFYLNPLRNIKNIMFYGKKNGTIDFSENTFALHFSMVPRFLALCNMRLCNFITDFLKDLRHGLIASLQN